MLIKNLDPGRLLELQKGTHKYMAGVAQLVRAPGCGSGGRRFDPGHSPHFFIHLQKNKASYGAFSAFPTEDSYQASFNLKRSINKFTLPPLVAKIELTKHEDLIFFEEAFNF